MFAKHTEKTIIILDIIGSFFVHTFYNDVYIKSENSVKVGNKISITSVYKGNIQIYMNAIKNEKVAERIVSMIHSYYQNKIGYFISFVDFEDKILCEFIPAEYYESFDSKNKDKTLYNIIKQTVSKFCAEILKKENILTIIDDHYNVNNVAIFQETILNIFMELRDEYHLKFVRESIGNKGSFDATTVNKLRQALVDEKKARMRLEKDKEKLTQAILLLNERLNNAQKPRETPVYPRETPAYPRETPAQSRETPAQSRENTVYPRETPAQSRENTTYQRENPAQSRENPTYARENPAQSRENPTFARENTQKPIEKPPLKSILRPAKVIEQVEEVPNESLMLDWVDETPKVWTNEEVKDWVEVEEIKPKRVVNKSFFQPREDSTSESE
jgi:hypothetical protein